jgi:hypothetical protein
LARSSRRSGEQRRRNGEKAGSVRGTECVTLDDKGRQAVFFLKKSCRMILDRLMYFMGPKNIGLGGVGLSSCYQGSVRFKKHIVE